MFHSVKNINSPARTILFGTFFTRTAFFMSTPFLGIYLTSVLHISVTQTGIILSAFPLIIVLLSGIIGSFTDKLALHQVLVLVAFFWGIIFILFFFASTFWHFLLLNSLNGCCYAFFEPAAKKVLSLETAPKHRLMAYNIRYTAINLGGFLGPLLSQLLQIQKSLVAYLLLGICYILYAGVLMTTLNDSKPPTSTGFQQQKSSHQWQIVLSDSGFIFLLAGVAFSYFGYSQFNSTLAQYLSLSTIFSNGTVIYAYIISLNSACILLLQFIMLRVTKNLSATTVLIISNLFLAGSVALCGWMTTLSGFVLVSLVYSLGELLLGSRFDAVVDSLAKEDVKSMYFGFAELIKAGSVLGPLIGAHLLEVIGINNGNLVFSFLAGITLFGSFFIFLAKKSRIR